MLSAFANCFKIPELRQRILFTLALVVVIRIGAAIPCPGINTNILAQYFTQVIGRNPNNTVIGMFNLFSGGALENCAVFTLGIIPYISASIMLQLMTAVVPSLSKLAREEGGRQKITQYTRYATILICIFQGFFYARQFENPEHSQLLSGINAVTSRFGPLVPNPGLTFEITTVISLLTGTLFADVAGRTDHRQGHWQRHLDGHHGEHRLASARRLASGLGHGSGHGHDR